MKGKRTKVDELRVLTDEEFEAMKADPLFQQFRDTLARAVIAMLTGEAVSEEDYDGAREAMRRAVESEAATADGEEQAGSGGEG